MECLTPPVEFVPLEEWFCPMCASHEDGQEGEEQKEEELTAAPRTRTTRGRPRGSTARRVSSSARTGGVFRDVPLEKLGGVGGRGRAKYQEQSSRKGKLREKNSSTASSCKKRMFLQ